MTKLVRISKKADSEIKALQKQIKDETGFSPTYSQAFDAYMSVHKMGTGFIIKKRGYYIQVKK